MVRLKVYSMVRSSVRICISIPYGAIKRQYLAKAGQTYSKFQFLMVRLKAVGNDAFYYSQFKFQFLMVRLKVYEDFRDIRSDGIFQFLMVRLKVLKIQCQRALNVISIPYGAIKRREINIYN